MTIYRVLWREPIIRELSDGRVVWLVQTCERWAPTLAGADQIVMDLAPTRIAVMTARCLSGLHPQWIDFVLAWDDVAVLEEWKL